MKEDLTKERDDQLQEIVKLRESLAEAQAKVTQMESEQEDNHAKMQEVSLVFETILHFNVADK